MHLKKLIIVPAHNEQANLKRTIQEIQQLTDDYHVLVIDDGSSDTSAEEARACGVEVVSLVFNLGIGGAVQTGLCYALENGFDVVIRIDADGQHDPASIKALLEPLMNKDADMAIGSRFLESLPTFQPGPMRLCGIHFLAGLISTLTGMKITDPTSGFCAWNTRAMTRFAEEYPIDFPEPESIVTAVRSGLKIREVPVRMRHRQAGVSSIHHLMSIYYMVKVTCAILIRMMSAV